MAKTAAIGIMCKAPQRGRAKSRLAAAVGADFAAGLSACFIRDVAASIEAVPEQLDRRGYGVYAPAGAEGEVERLLPPSFGLLLQVDDEFGNVLHGAMRALLAGGHDCVLLINGDSPTLPSAFLVEAIEALRRPGDLMVLGPASDGGYYLIGLKRAHSDLFSNIPWGTNIVAQRTLDRASQIGLPSMCLPEWYDIDDAESLGWLYEELAGQSNRFKNGGMACATRAYFATMAWAPK